MGVILAGRGRYEEAEPYLVDSYTRLLELRGETLCGTEEAYITQQDLLACEGYGR